MTYQKTTSAQTAQDNDLVKLARNEFATFVFLAFRVLYPNVKLVWAGYLELIAFSLESIAEGHYRRVIYNLPPRHMKSLLVSVLFPAWMLGRDPSAHFIGISYSPELAAELSTQTRKVMQSAVYAKIFPKTKLSKSAEDHIATTAGGYRFSTAVGSVITGFGAEYIIIDDPLQAADAASELAKQKLRDWVGGSVMSRFNDPKMGVMILVEHRLAPDDYTATMSPVADLHLSLPMIAEEEEPYDDEDGNILFERQPGEVLNSARLDAKCVEELRKSLPKHVWDGQYQQRPTAGGSGMISLDTFRRFDLKAPPQFELLIQSWDVGATYTGNASVCTTWGLKSEPKFGDVLYLVKVVRVKLQLPEVEALIIAEDKSVKPAMIIIDERGCGLGLYQNLMRKGLSHVLGTSGASEGISDISGVTSKPNESKIQRFGRSQLFINDGKVVLPTEALWLETFLYEVSAFPNIADDDQVDSMTQLISYFDGIVQRARNMMARRLYPLM